MANMKPTCYPPTAHKYKTMRRAPEHCKTYLCLYPCHMNKLYQHVYVYTYARTLQRDH